MEYRCRTIGRQLSLAEAMRSAAYRRLQLLVGDPEQPDLVSLQEQLPVKDVARLVAVACEIERSILSPRGEDPQGPAEIHITVAEEEPVRKDEHPGSDE